MIFRLRQENERLRQESEQVDRELEESQRETARLREVLRTREQEVQRLWERVAAQRARRFQHMAESEADLQTTCMCEFH